MKQFEAFKIRDKHLDKLNNPLSDKQERERKDEPGKILTIKPPKKEGGLKESIRLIKRLHTLEKEGPKNISPITSFEIWYENGELTFNMYVPNEDMELHVRKQIASHLEGVEIENNLEQFPNIRNKDYMTGARGELKRHYFEPIKSKIGVRSYEEDPYLSLLGEIDSKDETSVLVQTIIKPATFDWYKTPNTDAIKYAEKLKGNREMSTLGGLYKYKNNPDSEESQYAESIKKQVKDVGFYVNFRFCLFGNKTRIVQESKHLDNLIELEFEESTGQTLDPVPVQDVEDMDELFNDILYRNGRSLKEYMGFNDYFKEKLSNVPLLNILLGYEDFMKERIMMTPQELGGLIHFPKRNDVSTDSIKWAEFSFSGEGGENTGFEGFTEEEKEEYSNE